MYAYFKINCEGTKRQNTKDLVTLKLESVLIKFMSSHAICHADPPCKVSDKLLVK